MGWFSLKWLFVVVAVAALLSLPLSWLVRQRLDTSRQAAKVSHAVEAQTKAPPRIGYGVIGFRVEADFKGVAISEATAKALAENSQGPRVPRLHQAGRAAAWSSKISPGR